MIDCGEYAGPVEIHANGPTSGGTRIHARGRALITRDWVRLALGALVICAMVLIVYRPLLPGVFLMDDHRLVADDNPLVDGEFTIWNIWFQTDFILSNIGFWLQWLVWGEHPGGYHAVNMALHALSALVLWRVLARLRIPGAWVAALIYAVHPVAVTSVARIAELKNTLSLPFFLLSFWAFLRSDETDAERIPQVASPSPTTLIRPDPSKSTPPSFPWDGLSLAFFVLALLAKTSTIMLPVVLLLYVWWRRGRVVQRDARRLIPFFLLALVFGVASAWFQKYQALGDQPLPFQSFGERLALAGKVIWFYAGKVLLPLRLNAFYPTWKVNAALLTAYLPLLLVAVSFLIAWRYRRGWGRHFVFGAGCFVVTLFPVLGFFDAQYLTWFQVSDHLQYLPMISLLALAVAGLRVLLGSAGFRVAAALLLVGAATLGFARARVFSNEELLMRDCLAKNPAAWGAQNTLGTILARRNDLDGAIDNFRIALAYQPKDPLVNLNLAHALALQGRFEAAEPCFANALKARPVDPELHRQFATALEAQRRTREALREWLIALALNPDGQTRLSYAVLLFQTGNLALAETELRRVVLEKPDLPEALNNLAWLLATSGEDTLRNGPEAVQCAQKACALTGGKQAGMLGTLAAAYAEAGRFSEAVETCQRTIQLANRQGNPGFAALNNQLLNLYQMDRPYHGTAGNQ